MKKWESASLNDDKTGSTNWIPR